MNLATIFFCATIVITLGITVWAASRTKGRDDYYVAGGRITGFQNGLAIAGDTLSATTFLGITGIYFGTGTDPSGIFYLTPLVGFALMLLWIAAPLRRAGKFTLGDVMTSRLGNPKLRLFAGLSALIISTFYLVAQLVGAGGLISILFGLNYTSAVILVGILMTIYVAAGGMVAATWVQIVKAVILVGTVILMSVLAVVQAGGLDEIYNRASQVHPLGEALFKPGAAKMDLFSSISLAFGMTVGILGLPHILIRFFTVPDERQTRKSAMVATIIIGLVFAMMFAVLGPATIAFVRQSPEYFDASGGLLGGSNMAVIHLADALGGQALLGFCAAVAFATILAVVAGLVMSLASAISHDLWSVMRGDKKATEREELSVFRMGAGAVAVVGIALAIVFQHYNIAFLTTLAFGEAASANFPVLILILYWRRLTVAGALTGGLFGLFVSVALTILGPSVWVNLLKHPAPVFPSDFPALLVTPLTFAITVLVSLASKKAVTPPFSSASARADG